MIQPNEIRLNNWVLNHKGEHKQVKDICEDGSVWLRCNLCVKAKYRHKSEGLNPIPLTEDVLLKCKGVVKEYEDDRYGRVYLISNTKYIIRIVNFGNPLKEDFGFSLEISDNKDWCNIKRIYTLHDFQNTIYSLTNQELEIEL